MGPGSIHGSRPQIPSASSPAAGSARPATPAAAPASPAALKTAAGPAGPSDRFADAAHLSSQTSSAMAGGAAKPTSNRAALRAKGAGDSQKVGSAKNPAVFDKSGQINPAALKAYSQYDNDKKTTGDKARCSCNATVAALAMRGPEATLTGIQGAKAEMQEALKNATDPKEKKELQERIGTLEKIEAKAQKNQLTTKDLTQFADTMYRHFDAGKHNDDIMLNEDVVRMQSAVGLLPKDGSQGTVQGGKVGTVDFNETGMVGGTVDPLSKDFKDAQKAVAKDVLDQIQPGQSAIVGVFNPDPKAPPGATDRPNHFVTAGKTNDGQTYVYDPGNKPHYFTGKAAEEHLSKMVGVSIAPTYREVKDDLGNVTAHRRGVNVGATVIPQSEKTDGQALNDVSKALSRLGDIF